MQILGVDEGGLIVTRNVLKRSQLSSILPT